MSLKEKVLSLLEEHPGLKTHDISAKINADKREINKILYGPLKNEVWRDRSYRWYVGRPQSATDTADETAPADTPIARLCSYYIDCLSQDNEQGVSTFAANDRGDLDYAEIQQLPFGGDVGLSVFDLEDSKRLFGKVKRDRGRLILYLGYPTRLRHHRTPRWEGYFVEPIFLFPYEFDPSDRYAVPEISSELPMINFKVLQRLTEGGSSNVIEEAIVLSEELGLNNPQEDLPDPDDIFQSLRAVRPDWDWKEEIDPYEFSNGPPLSEMTEQGIYNRAIIISGERSLYTQGLETELKDLSRLPEDHYKNTALGRWLAGDFSTIEPVTIEDESEVEPNGSEDLPSGSKPLLEVLPMNTEQRTAVKNSLTEELTVITGPPGTGKSQVVSNILINAAWEGQKVLFASKNNKAVDVVERRVNALGVRPILLRLGSKEYQGKLADYLTKLLSATSSPEDEESYKEAIEEHEKLVQVFEELEEKIQRTLNARNAVDVLEKSVEVHRDVFATEIFDGLKIHDPVATKEKLSLLQRRLAACQRNKQGLFIRLLWPFVRKGRFKELVQCVGPIRTLASKLGLKALSGSPDETSIENWDRFEKSLSTLSVKAAEVNRYFSSLKHLQTLPSFEDLAKSHMELAEKISINSGFLWEQWVKLQPSRLTGEDKRLLNDYASLLSLLVKSRKRVGGNVYRRYLSLIPKVSNLMPCWAVTSLSARGKIPFEAGFFDILVIDEASQCDIASALPLLYRAKRAVIIGDPNQLSHISSISENKDVALQEKHNIVEDHASWMYSVNSLYKLASGLTKPENIIDLRDHHRSHSAIIQFSNQYFYEGRLRVATRYDRLNFPGEGEPAVRWTHLEGQVRKPPGGGAVNEQEAKAVVDNIRDLVQVRGYRGTIGVVSPFRIQANRIREMVFQDNELSATLMALEFLADTVHKFQGDERDVMFFSPVVSRGTHDGALFFLKKTPNLFNVAITRARSLLHVIGDQTTAVQSNVDYLAKFAEHVQGVQEQRSTGEMPANMDFGPDYPTVSNPEQVSPWEHYFYKALYHAGIRPIPQYSEEHYILDFALLDGERKLNLEVDGERYHRNWNGELCRRDQIRNQRLIELGWEVKRFWVYEIRDELERCVEWVSNWVNNT